MVPPERYVARGCTDSQAPNSAETISNTFAQAMAVGEWVRFGLAENRRDAPCVGSPASCRTPAAQVRVASASWAGDSWRCEMDRCVVVCMSSERVDKVQKSLGRCPPETRNQISTGNERLVAGRQRRHGLGQHEFLGSVCRSSGTTMHGWMNRNRYMPNETTRPPP
jgi:hypothetical protein